MKAILTKSENNNYANYLEVSQNKLKHFNVFHLKYVMTLNPNYKIRYAFKPQI